MCRTCHCVEQACAEQKEKDRLAIELEAAAARLRVNNREAVVNKPESPIESTDIDSNNLIKTGEVDNEKQRNCT